MYKCVSEYYNSFILNARKVKHKLRRNEIIALVLICLGALLMTIPSLLARYISYTTVIWILLAVGFGLFIIGFVLDNRRDKKYWRKDENILVEMGNESYRADLLAAFLRRDDINLYHRDTLQYLIEEGDEKKNEPDFFLAVFAGTGVTAYVAGLISSTVQAILTDFLDKTATAMSIPIYIYSFLVMADIIMCIFAAGIMVRNHEEKKRIRIKKLQGDLRFILATFDDR